MDGPETMIVLRAVAENFGPIALILPYGAPQNHIQ